MPSSRPSAIVLGGGADRAVFSDRAAPRSSCSRSNRIISTSCSTLRSTGVAMAAATSAEELGRYAEKLRGEWSMEPAVALDRLVPELGGDRHKGQVGGRSWCTWCGHKSRIACPSCSWDVYTGLPLITSSVAICAGLEANSSNTMHMRHSTVVFFLRNTHPRAGQGAGNVRVPPKLNMRAADMRRNWPRWPVAFGLSLCDTSSRLDESALLQERCQCPRFLLSISGVMLASCVLVLHTCSLLCLVSVVYAICTICVFACAYHVYYFMCRTLCPLGPNPVF